MSVIDESIKLIDTFRGEEKGDKEMRVKEYGWRNGISKAALLTLPGVQISTASVARIHVSNT